MWIAGNHKSAFLVDAKTKRLSDIAQPFNSFTTSISEQAFAMAKRHDGQPIFPSIHFTLAARDSEWETGDSESRSWLDFLGSVFCKSFQTGYMSASAMR